MGIGRQARIVRLLERDRKVLEALVRQGAAAQRDVMRAKIALMCDEGQPTVAITASLGMSIPSVSKWRSRIAGAVAGARRFARPDDHTGEGGFPQEWARSNE